MTSNSDPGTYRRGQYRPGSSGSRATIASNLRCSSDAMSRRLERQTARLRQSSLAMTQASSPETTTKTQTVKRFMELLRPAKCRNRVTAAVRGDRQIWTRCWRPGDPSGNFPVSRKNAPWVRVPYRWATRCLELAAMSKQHSDPAVACNVTRRGLHAANPCELKIDLFCRGLRVPDHVWSRVPAESAAPAKGPGPDSS